MTQILPDSNQFSFPVSVGLLGSPPRIGLFCPSTGLSFDPVFDAHYDWIGTGSVTMDFSIDTDMVPAGYTALAVQAEAKPFSTVNPAITSTTTGGITLSRPFPTTTLSSTATFNVWVTGEAPDGPVGIVAWMDPAWPVGKLGSGGPSSLQSQQTNYYFMNTATQTIPLVAKTDGTIDWLQTPFGAIVGATLVVSPPQNATQRESLAVTVEITTPTGLASTTINTTVGSPGSGTLGYSINGASRIAVIEVLDEPATPPTPIT